MMHTHAPRQDTAAPQLTIRDGLSTHMPNMPFWDPFSMAIMSSLRLLMFDGPEVLPKR